MAMPSAFRPNMAGPLALPPAFRVWNKHDNWCSLCHEPFGQWNEHRGKRDHLCLELFFESVFDYHRLWSPGTVWANFERDFRQTAMKRLFIRHDLEESIRRAETLEMLKLLADEGILEVAPARQRDIALHRVGTAQQGALVMFKWMHPHILNVFPYIDAKQISAFSQMVSSTYNLETTFDMCNWKDLLKPGDLNPGPGGEIVPIENIDFSTKSNLVRSVLGQLRWAMEWDRPRPKLNSYARACPPHLSVVAEKAGHAIITDMMFCRICEYVSRVEPVWREHVAMLDGGTQTFMRSKAPEFYARKHKSIPKHFMQAARTSGDHCFARSQWNS